MTKVEFFFDPSCPFSWITSRWLLQVNRERSLDITWRQFSLALKNSALTASPNESSHAKAHRASHRLHRVMMAAAEQHRASLIDLYSDFGSRFHLLEQAFDDDMIRQVLAKNSLPAELLDSADDSSLDEKLQLEIDAAVAAAGPDIGVPTIVFSGPSGERLGYFGPVLSKLPDSLEESLNLWDGLEKLASSPNFFEIKRPRKDGPDVFSTARC